MANKCCLTTYSKGHGVVSLSSGESKYYGGACQTLGIASTAKDWGLFPSKEVTMDASAGIAWETVEVWDEPNMLTLSTTGPLGTRAYSKERVSSQERRRRPNVGRRANESCHRGGNDYSHERHELPLPGR